MFSRDSIRYRVARELANIIHPLVGQSPHHLKNTEHFVQHIQEVKLEPGKVMTSNDVKALSNSVSVHPSIKVIKNTPGPCITPKNQHVHPTHHHIFGVVPQKHILPLPR